MPDRLDVRTRDQPRLPPGQIETVKWPVLHYGRVPRADLARWTFRVFGEVERPVRDPWTEFEPSPARRRLRHPLRHHLVALRQRVLRRPVLRLLERAGVRPNATHVLVHAEEDYTTNLPLPDLAREANLIATHHDGEPLLPEHGGPARLLVPHLYFWKSAKWVRGLR